MNSSFDAISNTYSGLCLLPYKEPELAREKAVNFPPSTTIARGTILGQVSAAANDVQTLTITATGGTYKLQPAGPTASQNIASPYGANWTAAIAYNANAATIQAALAAVVGAGNLVVTGTGPFTITAAGNLANQPLALIAVDNTAATGGTAAVTRGTMGATLGTYAAYASGNSNGTQVARAIAKYDVITDAAGNVFFGTTVNSQFNAPGQLTAPVYTAGVFRTVQLVGYDANARANLAGHLESGSDADGVLRIT